MPTISVIVPVYNVENYLKICVTSILAQTYSDFELILIDDGSTDSSGKICDEYAIIDNRIIVIHQTNQGQAAARNTAVQIAKGEWIHFVDSDDMIHPQMLEVLYNGAKLYNANICMCETVEDVNIPNCFYNSIDQVEYSTENVSEEYLNQLYSYGKHRYGIVCAKLIRKNIVSSVPFSNGRIYEDTAVVCQWIYMAQTVVNTDATLYFYRNNPISTINSTFSIKKLDMLWSINQTIEFYKKINYNRLLRRAFIAYMETAVTFYKKHKDFLKCNNALNVLLREMKCVYKANRPLIEIDKNFDEYICGIIFPSRTKIKCIFNKIFRSKM